MAKGMYHFLKEAWKKPDIKTLRERMIEWRRSQTIIKVDNNSNSLAYLKICLIILNNP